MPRVLANRTLLWIGLPLLMLAASGGAVSGTVAIFRDEGDRIEILGSGDGVSIRITTGRTELLIATGNDRTAFGNAYDHVSAVPGARPDILLLAGSERSLNVPSRAVEQFSDAISYPIHPLSAGSTGAPDLATLPPLPRDPIRFTLDGRVVVTVESHPVDDDGDFAWRAVIARDTSRVAVISSLERADLFSWTEPISVLIVAGDASSSDSGQLGWSALVGSAVTLDPRGNVDGGGSGAHSAHVVPVRPGGVATVRFVESGVELRSDDRILSNSRSSSGSVPSVTALE